LFGRRINLYSFSGSSNQYLELIRCVWMAIPAAKLVSRALDQIEKRIFAMQQPIEIKHSRYHGAALRSAGRGRGILHAAVGCSILATVLCVGFDTCKGV
jgi:6-phosphogluconate dehydrogenase (decarboxylating)